MEAEMQLTRDQVRRYREDGLLVVEAALTAREVRILREAFERDSRVPGQHRIIEESNNEIRAIYASHQRQREFAATAQAGGLAVCAE